MKRYYSFCVPVLALVRVPLESSAHEARGTSLVSGLTSQNSPFVQVRSDQGFCHGQKRPVSDSASTPVRNLA